MLARKIRHRRRGFTLTELMVSLVMGLIVALAAVALARSATSTFHEQARSSTTEMSVRVASDRLRQDLMRASYMSTGNIALDPKVAKLERDLSTPSAAARYTQFAKLRGIEIDVNTAAAGAVPATLTTNSIRPDAIILTGNLTTDDAYTGVIQSGAVTGVAATSDGSCSNFQSIILDPAADASTYSLGGGAASSVSPAVLLANAKAAFMPVGLKKYIAQVTDAIGCNHYVPVCDVAVSGAAPNPTLVIMVEAHADSRAVLYSNAAAGDQPLVARNCGASEGGKVTIAPVSRVRWRISQAAAATKPNAADEATLGANAKTDLVREVLDWEGAVTFTEVVAEYIVDLKFGIGIDDPKEAGPLRQKIYDIDSDTGTGNIHKTTSSADAIVAGNAGPQRVRTVRYRVAARTAVPDRADDLPLGAGQIRARYCVDTDVAACAKGWTRVRTITSEVALLNQQGMLY